MQNSGRALEAFTQDVRHALRVSRRFPAFTAIVVLTLGIAIGANTAIFSIVNATLLRPLGFPDDEELAVLTSQNPRTSDPRFSVSYADFLDWRKQTRSFAGMTALMSGSPTLYLRPRRSRICRRSPHGLPHSIRISQDLARTCSWLTTSTSARSGIHCWSSSSRRASCC